MDTLSPNARDLLFALRSSPTHSVIIAGCENTPAIELVARLLARWATSDELVLR